MADDKYMDIRLMIREIDRLYLFFGLRLDRYLGSDHLNIEQHKYIDSQVKYIKESVITDLGSDLEHMK